MESNIKTSFWLVKSKRNKHRECPIYLRIHYGGASVQISTGHYVLASKWDKRKKRIMGADLSAQAINEHLVTLETKVLKVVNRLVLDGKPFNIHTVKERMITGNVAKTTLFTAYDEYLDMMRSLIGIDYSKPTLIKYSNTKKRLKSYIKKRFGRKDMYMYELDYEFMDGFITYLKTDYHNSQTTCYKHYQRFTRVVRIAMRKGYLDKYPFEEYSIKLPKKPIQFLTKTEIDQIEQTHFEMERLNIVRDIFIFSCYTGLAYTEVFNLSPKNLIQDEEGDWWLNIFRQKTKKEFKIPMLPKAMEIINKYKDHPISQRRKKLIPIPSNQKMNSYLKEIQDVCGIKKKLHFHLARKSFSVSIVLSNSIPIETLSVLLGHSSIKVTAEAYASITDDKIKNDFSKLRDQIDNHG